MTRLSALLRLAAVTCAIVPAHATVLLPAELGDLSREAWAIARGTVVAVEARWTDDRRRVETIVTLEAESSLKGALGATVQFRVPGGRLGRYRNIVLGAPEFAVGQRVVVFLGARGPRLPYLVGLGQGVFRLAPRDGGWMVTPPAVLPGAGTAPTRIVRGDPARRAVPLEDFEREVRMLAGLGP